MRGAALTLLVVIAGSSAPARIAAVAACQPPLEVGFKVVRVGGMNVGVWYPTTGGEADIDYAKNVKGRARTDGAADSCARCPRVVFSHGFLGCGTQIVYLTEELARRGYIDKAPKGKRAQCSVTGTGTT